jgi:hypothetical protein
MAGKETLTHEFKKIFKTNLKQAGVIFCLKKLFGNLLQNLFKIQIVEVNQEELKI